MQKPAGMQASKKADPPKTHREFTSENFLGSRRRKSPPACPEERPGELWRRRDETVANTPAQYCVLQCISNLFNLFDGTSSVTLVHRFRHSV